jgi:N-acetylneuraminate synthase
MKFFIGKNIISNSSKTYFIADIAANHDGKIERAKKLIYLAAEAGANAVKFQNFLAKTIVSNYGFKSLKKKLSHQSKWRKSIFQVYKDAELPLSWTAELEKTSKSAGIDYFTAPYDSSIISYLNKYVCAWKIGSGDITRHEHIIKIAKTKKPIIIATGASDMNEIESIVKKVKKINNKIVLMQCNTNYTADIKNFKYINLNVLKNFKRKYPNIILGLSDHTPGHETVLGAISLGAKVIEKHFTDSNTRSGPDHFFSMNPKSWREMIISSRKLEESLGSNIKKVEKNEKLTVILQRRSVRANRIIKKGEKIKKKDLCFLRPYPKNSLSPFECYNVINKKAKKQINFHEVINLLNVK